MTDIFLSYSSKDRERVRPLCEALAAAGYDVFWDQEVPTGVNWNKWIMEHLGSARLVIVAWSKNSVASDNVIHEATIAREDGKLAPCLLELLSTRDFPLGFYTTQAAPLHDWTGQAAHKGYQNLMTAVRTRLSGAAAAAQAIEQGEAADIADLRRRAVGGDAHAQAQLAYRYYIGQGVLQDYNEAARLFELAANGGNADGQFNLGVMYSKGEGRVQDQETAVRLYRQAASQDHGQAICCLGYVYEKGQGVVKDDAEAVRFYRQAADKGNADAQISLGLMYESGRGVGKDDGEAARLYKLAAEQGSAIAQINLGLLYEQGRGVPKDDREAARLCKLAADQGNSAAQLNLGIMYNDGRGDLPKDRDEAMRLWKLAAAGGHENAQTFLKSQGIPW